MYGDGRETPVDALAEMFTLLDEELTKLKQRAQHFIAARQVGDQPPERQIPLPAVTQTVNLKTNPEC